MQRFLMVAATMLGAAAVAGADELIWDNSGVSINPNLSVVTYVDSEGLPGAYKSECADDFMLAAAATVTRITPQYFLGRLQLVDHWNVVIYEDDGGIPGAALLTTTAPGDTYVASPPDQVISLTLAQPFAASAGTRYWIGLQPAYAFQNVDDRVLRWREIVVADPSEIHGNVGYWRGTPVFGGLVLDWTWEPVGNKNGVGTTTEMLFQLYSAPTTGACCVGIVCTDDKTAAECAAMGGVYKGDGSVCKPVPTACFGDADCSGAIDFDDINYFVAALAGGEAGWTSYYKSRHGGEDPPCTFWNCDANGSGQCADPQLPEVDFDDINSFVAKLVNPPPCP